MEHVIWRFGDGSTVSAYDTSLGAAICWESLAIMKRIVVSCVSRDGEEKTEKDDSVCLVGCL